MYFRNPDIPKTIKYALTPSNIIAGLGDRESFPLIEMYSEVCIIYAPWQSLDTLEQTVPAHVDMPEDSKNGNKEYEGPTASSSS